MGMSNQISSNASFAVAIGNSNSVTGSQGITIGANNAAASNAIAIGIENQINASNAYVLGRGNIVNSQNEVVLGSFASTSSNPASTTNTSFIGNRALTIGNGTADNQRKNAVTIFENGNTVVQGKMLVTDTIFSGNFIMAGSIALNQSSSTNSYRLPVTRGTIGQFLQSDGNGSTNWVAPQILGTSNGGILVLSGTGSWTVPEGIKKFYLVLIGGGGGGQAVDQGCLNGCWNHGSAGGGGAFIYASIPCNPGDILNYSIGIGGAAGTGCYGDRNGQSGESSYININGSRVATANGGIGGGNGGSGGSGIINTGVGISNQGGSGSAGGRNFYGVPGKIQPSIIYVNPEAYGKGGTGACCTGCGPSQGVIGYGAIIY
jgi:hypothetical protein